MTDSMMVSRARYAATLMQTRRLTVEAPSSAAFAHILTELDHEARGIVTATENGQPWAAVEVSPTTDTRRSVFPVSREGVRGDTNKRAHAGILTDARGAGLPVVIDRARRMFNA